MSTESPQDDRAQPGASVSTIGNHEDKDAPFLESADSRRRALESSSRNEVKKTPSKCFTYDNEQLKNPELTSISNGTTGKQENSNTYIDFSLRHKHNININREKEEEKREALACSSGSRGYRSTIWVNRDSWQKFLSVCREMGYSASELLNQYITAVVTQAPELPSKTPVNFNIAIAIAKAEAKPVINVGDFIAEKQLDTVISKVRSLKDKADRERRESDTPISYTVSRSKELEEDILRVLRGVKRISPAKLEEVNAALTVLRSIRGGGA